MDAAHTFLFADLAGFTALTEVHGDDHAADLVGDFCQAVSAQLAGHGAEQVKSIGDAVLVRVPEPRSAVRLGIRIVDEIGGRHQVPLVRVGMHTGPAVERHGDWFGASVNLAARVAAMALGGEVLLSGATREAVDKDEEVEFTDRGVHRFLHVSEEIRIFAARAVGSVRRVLPIDPVCRMAIDPREARIRLHAGRQMHFCSETCEQAFVADPELYSDIRRP